jgi:hypothetical protein
MHRLKLRELLRGVLRVLLLGLRLRISKPTVSSDDHRRSSAHLLVRHLPLMLLLHCRLRVLISLGVRIRRLY